MICSSEAAKASIGEWEMTTYPIILADNHAPLRRGIRRILAERSDLEVVGETGEGSALLDLLGSTAVGPLLVVLDLALSNLPGSESVRNIKAIRPEAKVLILGLDEDAEYLRQALSIGAEGYLVVQKVGKELLQAIETIRAGKVYISPGLACLAAD